MKAVQIDIPKAENEPDEAVTPGYLRLTDCLSAMNEEKQKQAQECEKAGKNHELELSIQNVEKLLQQQQAGTVVVVLREDLFAAMKERGSLPASIQSTVTAAAASAAE